MLRKKTKKKSKSSLAAAKIYSTMGFVRFIGGELVAKGQRENGRERMGLGEKEIW